MAAPMRRSAVFVFLDFDPPRWFQLDLRPDGVEARFSFNKFVIGDQASPAVFFSEEYYHVALSVRELIPLAAHVILMGAQCNPLGVDGLEMIFCEGGCPTPWRNGAPALNVLRKHSERLSKTIAKQLTDPNVTAAFRPRITRTAP